MHLLPRNKTAHPLTYKARSFPEKDAKLEEIIVQWKDPAPDQVVVKVLACGVCGSDELVQRGALPDGFPRIPGHEIIGEIIARGPNVTNFKLGQRVGAGWHGGQCGVCESCRVGDFITCENQTINGVSVDGGYAEYATLRTDSLAVIPEGMDPVEAAPLFCAGVTCFNSLRHMNVSPGEIVAIQGIGGLGHLAIQFSKAMGFRTVALSSSSANKELALKLSASEYIDGSVVNQGEALRKMGGAKVVVCTAQSADVIEELVGGLKVGGQLLVLGFPDEPARVPLGKIVQFAKDAGVKTVIQKYPLKKAQEALNNLPKARFRAVLVP